MSKPKIEPILSIIFDAIYETVCFQLTHFPFDDIKNICTSSYYMMTSSNGNIFRVTGPLCGEFTGPGEFPAQRPVTRSFDVFFDLRPNKRLSKQPRGWWFDTSSWSLWRQCNYLHQIGNTVDSRYNTVHYNNILHSSLLKQRQNINQRPNPQNLLLYNGNPLYGSSAIV